MKRLTITLLLMLSYATLLTANPTSVFIWMKDGSKTVFLLSEKPLMTFDDDEMMVQTNATTICLPYGQLKNITYKDGTDDDGISEQHQRSFVYDGQRLEFQAGTTPLKVLLVSTDGKMLRQLSLKASEHASIPADNLPAGSYAVVVNGVTYKILKP